jgi:hypothetical protein
MKKLDELYQTEMGKIYEEKKKNRNNKKDRSNCIHRKGVKRVSKKEVNVICDKNGFLFDGWTKGACQDCEDYKEKI